jgi:hypothetical protein
MRSIRPELLNAGMNLTGFSEHSLRRGAAVSAVVAGILELAIRVLKLIL